jgi:hypothetical protein
VDLGGYELDESGWGISREELEALGAIRQETFDQGARVVQAIQPGQVMKREDIGIVFLASTMAVLLADVYQKRLLRIERFISARKLPWKHRAVSISRNWSVFIPSRSLVVSVDAGGGYVSYMVDPYVQ